MIKKCPQCEKILFPLFERKNNSQVLSKISYNYKCNCGWNEKIEIDLKKSFYNTTKHVQTQSAAETQSES